VRAKAVAGDSDRHTNLDGSESASQTLGSYGPFSYGRAVERQFSELSSRRGRRTRTCTCHYRLAKLPSRFLVPTTRSTMMQNLVTCSTDFASTSLVTNSREPCTITGFPGTPACRVGLKTPDSLFQDGPSSAQVYLAASELTELLFESTD
jgi:hypothetical protein